MKTKNSNLTAAKAAKNNEFYTRLSDIENELKYYKDQFKDKIVYCNCDNPQRSEFVRFFRLKFVDYGLKKLIATCITEDNSNGLAYVWDRDINGNGIADEDEVTIFKLNQNGDFRSDECIEYLKQCDIVVTNPPFSLYREFISTIMDYDKKFLVIANDNSITYKEIFPYIKEGKLRSGKNKPKQFVQPDGTLKKFGNISWYTNLLVHKAETPMELTEKYDPIKYPKYDNYDAINCNKVSDIPYDYDGVIGVPITIVDKIADDGYIHFTHTGVDDDIKSKVVDRLNTPIFVEREREREADLSNSKYVHNEWNKCELLDINKQETEICKNIYSKDIIFEIVEFRKGSDGKDLIYSSLVGGYSSTILQSTHSITSIPGMIKNSEGKINGKITYARVLIQKIK